MEIRRFRNKEGKVVYSPVNKTDAPLFLHCSGGVLEVEGRQFNVVVVPIMRQHYPHGFWMNIKNEVKRRKIVMHWSSSCGRIELNITKAQAARGAHPGPCDSDIAALRTVPAIRRQLAKLNPAHVAAYLQEFGAWDAAELADHDQNLSRLLWTACGDINEGK